MSLGAGYAWLALGLLAVGGSAPGNVRTAALHLITIGALGTLTANVMANTVLLKMRRPPAMEWIPVGFVAVFWLVWQCVLASMQRTRRPRDSTR
jgi:uncharacterized protein involved in response to NO